MSTPDAVLLIGLTLLALWLYCDRDRWRGRAYDLGIENANLRARLEGERRIETRSGIPAHDMTADVTPQLDWLAEEDTTITWPPQRATPPSLILPVDLDDEVAWEQTNPALGIRITREAMVRDLLAMADDTVTLYPVRAWGEFADPNPHHWVAPT